MKTINLDELIQKHVTAYHGMDGNVAIRVKFAMEDFGKQLLELAAENAQMSMRDDLKDKTWSQKRINFKSFGCKYSARVEKSSILNTINQVV
jgi:hypothetical protein